MTGSVQSKTFSSRGALAALAGALVLLSSCNSSPKVYDHGERGPGVLKPLPPPPSLTADGTQIGATGAGGAPGAPIVTGNCPQVSLREGTASMRKYAKGAKDDPTKLVFQASLAETTRQCTVNNGIFTITVQAQGRLIAGPLGKAGDYVLPIRVAVLDGDTTLYTNLVKFNAELPPGQSAGQYLFTKNDVAIPGGVGPTARVYLGFDEGPYNTK